MATGGGWKDFVRGAKHTFARLPRVLSSTVKGVRELHAGGWLSWKGVKYLWTAAHNDQRLSWFGHYLVSIGGFSTGLGAVSFIVALAWSGGDWSVGVDGFRFGWRHGSTVSFAFFMIREMIDEAKWRKLLMWDKVDKDVSVQGKKREGVTRRYDKIGDLTGPTFHFVSTWAAVGVGLL